MEAEPSTPGLLRRLARLDPFRSLVWPGTGPRVDPRRDWPELAILAAAGLLFARGAPPAVTLSVLAAGLGMWWLGVVLGAGRLGRTWAGLIAAFAGSAAAAFGQGHFGLALGCGWMPWALAWGLAAAQARRRLYAALAAVAVGLTLLGGDHGLVLATLLVLAMAILLSAISLRPGGRPLLVFDRASVSVVTIIGVSGIGLAAVQLLPALAVGGATPAMVSLAAGGGTSGLAGVLAALVVKADALGGLVATVGSVPLFCLALLPWVARRSRGAQRSLAALGLICAFALVVAATGWLSGALLAWAAVALVALAGLGLDAAWAQARANLVLRRVRVPEAVRWAAAQAGMVALPLLAAWSAGALYVSNRPLLATTPEGWSGIGMLRASVAQQPLVFWAGAVMSGVSFLGILALIVGDARARRRSIEAEAVYEAGALRPAEPLDLPDGTSVHVTVEPAGGDAETRGRGDAETQGRGDAETQGRGDEVPGREAPAPTAVHVSPRLRSYLPWLLFMLGIGVYLATRFWSIESFPIYFFTDEAANPLFAQDLIAHGFRNASGERFPLYFELAANRWGPLLSVYIHAISMTLFGKSVLVTRGTQAVLSVLAAVAISLSLKLAFKARFWWIGTLLLALAPTWFLHSRTGFETVIAASFYGCFILFYLLYRTRSPRYLYPAILFGAATFYTYSNGQMTMAAAGVLLALFDMGYHLKNWRTALPGLLLVGVLMIPMLRFRAAHPGLLESHLRILNSYWYYDTPLTEKLAQFVKTYAYGLSPAYWFLPSTPKEPWEVRHLMQGYGNLAIWTLPFFLIGAGVSLWRAVKGSAPHKVLLLATLATPAGAALAQVALTRVMAFVVPATILIAVGIEAVLAEGWKLLAGTRGRGDAETGSWKLAAGGWQLAAILFAVLAVPAVLMTRDALFNGPLWYRDYELYGMQYGATQLFGDEIPSYLAEHPDRRVIVSPTWANGTDSFIRFFLTEAQQVRVQMLNVDHFMAARRPLDSSMVLVMTQHELDQARASGKFKSVEVERTVPYPDGRTGFYFVRLAYADDLDDILARERQERSRPVAEQIVLDGQTVEVLHSQFDGGRLADLFDGDTFTLARGLEANPLVFELTFPQPRELTGLSATFGSMDFALKVSLAADAEGEPVVYEQTYRGLPPDPTVELDFDRGPGQVSRVRLEVFQLNAGGDVHIHVRELTFK